MTRQPAADFNSFSQVLQDFVSRENACKTASDSGRNKLTGNKEHEEEQEEEEGEAAVEEEDDEEEESLQSIR